MYQDMQQRLLNNPAILTKQTFEAVEILLHQALANNIKHTMSLGLLLQQTDALIEEETFLQAFPNELYCRHLYNLWQLLKSVL